MDALLAALEQKHGPKEPWPHAPYWFCMAEDRPPPSIRDIQNAVVAKFGVSRNDLLASRRTKNIGRAKIVGMYLCRKLTKRPYNFIAKKFERCDHSVVISACHRVEYLIQVDAKLASDVAALEAMFA